MKIFVFETKDDLIDYIFETKDDLIDYILNHMFHYLANEKDSSLLRDEKAQSIPCPASGKGACRGRSGEGLGCLDDNFFWSFHKIG